MKKRLDSLRIERFRQIRELTIPELGHVNLVVGKNNSGKSSLLDALRFYAGRASPTLLNELLDGRSELALTQQLSTQSALQAHFLSTKPGRVLSNLFYGRRFPQRDPDALFVGDMARKNYVWLADVYVRHSHETGADGSTVRRERKISKEDAEGLQDPDVVQYIEIKTSESPGMPTRISLDDLFLSRGTGAQYESGVVEIPNRYVSPNLDPDEVLAEDWDGVVLTNGEDLALNALRIFEPKVQGLAFVQGARMEGGRYRMDGFPQRRTAVLKMDGLALPVPLQSMGEGMLRALRLALSGVRAEDGFLLVDEFENGLHHSVQANVWAMLFDLAKTRGLQIFATTHSNDCVRAFSQVALANLEVDGKLLKLERMPEDGQTVAAALGEDDLSNLLDADIEVRG